MFLKNKIRQKSLFKNGKAVECPFQLLQHNFGKTNEETPSRIEAVNEKKIKNEAILPKRNSFGTNVTDSSMFFLRETDTLSLTG